MCILKGNVKNSFALAKRCFLFAVVVLLWSIRVANEPRWDHEVVTKTSTKVGVFLWNKPGREVYPAQSGKPNLSDPNEMQAEWVHFLRNPIYLYRLGF